MKRAVFTFLFGLLLLGSDEPQAQGPSTIKPSQAFPSALKLAEEVVVEELEIQGQYRISAAELWIGKYDIDRFGDYNIELALFTEDASHECHLRLHIRRVPFAKQPQKVHILEEQVNDYQIIGRINGLKCEP